MAAGGTPTTKQVKMAAPEMEERKKRTKLVRVKQGYIDWLLIKREKLADRLTFPSVSDEVIDGTFRGRPELREKLRLTIAEIAAAMKKIHGVEEDILGQYHAKGYAMEEVEISDDGDGEDDGSCSSAEVEGPGHRSRL